MSTFIADALLLALKVVKLVPSARAKMFDVPLSLTKVCKCQSRLPIGVEIPELKLLGDPF
jgi:hypothetical protein